MFGVRMLSGYGTGGPVPVAADRTPATDGVLCVVLVAHHLPDVVSGHIAHSAHVSIQLGKSGKCVINLSCVPVEFECSLTIIIIL